MKKLEISRWQISSTDTPEWRYLDRSDWPRSLLKYVLPKQSYEMHPAKAKRLKIHHRGWIWTTMAIHSYLMRDQLRPPGFWLFSILFSASFCYQSREIVDSFIFLTFNYHFPPKADGRTLSEWPNYKTFLRIDWTWQNITEELFGISEYYRQIYIQI